MILCLSTNGEEFEIFDVHNNGYDFGGKLQRTIDRYMFVQNDSVLVTKSVLFPKIVHRRFLTDVTLTIGIPVIFRTNNSILHGFVIFSGSRFK